MRSLPSFDYGRMYTAPPMAIGMRPVSLYRSSAIKATMSPVAINKIATTILLFCIDILLFRRKGTFLHLCNP